MGVCGGRHCAVDLRHPRRQLVQLQRLKNLHRLPHQPIHLDDRPRGDPAYRRAGNELRWPGNAYLKPWIERFTPESALIRSFRLGTRVFYTYSFWTPKWRACPATILTLTG